MIGKIETKADFMKVKNEMKEELDKIAWEWAAVQSGPTFQTSQEDNSKPSVEDISFRTKWVDKSSAPIFEEAEESLRGVSAKYNLFKGDFNHFYGLRTLFDLSEEVKAKLRKMKNEGTDMQIKINRLWGEINKKKREFKGTDWELQAHVDWLAEQKED